MKLSNRQLQAVKYAANGHTIEEAARLMGVSPQMFARHLKLARDKLDAKNTNHAIYKACQRGLICFLIVTMQLSEARVYWDYAVHMDIYRISRRTKTKRDSDLTIIQHLSIQGRNVVV